MEQEIVRTLKAQERESNVTILYACESGSRAWGFASPDSDYDVRFIYTHSMEWYLSLFDNPDVIEKPINDLLDISGWNLRKALTLLYKSNMPVIEWLHSPITYIANDQIVTMLRGLAKSSFQPLSACYHYLGMAKTGWADVEGQIQVKLKRYFYVLRALLCCEWIINESTIPPVEFALILDAYYRTGEFRDVIDILLNLKSATNESDLLLRENHTTDFYKVDNKIRELFQLIPLKLPLNRNKADRDQYDEVFRKIILN